jgi:GT2 family glycosyltransferase
MLDLSGDWRTLVKVTAAITTYNRADYVVHAVESVLEQTSLPCEVVVVDDGSTDDTRSRLAAYANRIQYIHQPNAGRAAARNAALALARSPYIGFLDSDDTWLPDKLARQVPVLDADRQVALVHGHVEIIDELDRPRTAEDRRHRALTERGHRTPASYDRYCLQCPCLTSATLMRVDALRELGGYDTSLEALEDLDLYLRLSMHWKVAFVGGAAVARYRGHSGQTDARASLLSEIRVCEKHIDVLATARVPRKRKARRNLYLRLAGCYHRTADAKRTRRWLVRAILIDPSAVARPSALRQLALSFLPRSLRARLWKMRGASLVS